MVSTTLPTPCASPWVAHVARIDDVRREAPGINTYALTLQDEALADQYRFRPGQFNMLYEPGYGESAISISSDPADPRHLLHTVRMTGNVTSALARHEPGETIGLRGPFGSSWPVEECRGCDIIMACGGVGLPPMRPMIYHIMKHRQDFERVILLYGARTPGDLLFTDEYPAWQQADIEVDTTVDIGEPDWTGRIGVVPVLFYRLRLEPRRTRILTCGPEIMIRFVIFEALARKVPREHIYLSMERNMQCALGLCGQCQLGPAFVCKDGPVFTYRQMEPYLHVEEM